MRFNGRQQSANNSDGCFPFHRENTDSGTTMNEFASQQGMTGRDDIESTPSNESGSTRMGHDASVNSSIPAEQMGQFGTRREESSPSSNTMLARKRQNPQYDIDSKMDEDNDDFDDLDVDVEENRSGAELNEPEHDDSDNDNGVNYSITRRWRRRSKKLEELYKILKDWAWSEDFLDNIPADPKRSDFFYRELEQDQDQGGMSVGQHTILYSRTGTSSNQFDKVYDMIWGETEDSVVSNLRFVREYMRENRANPSSLMLSLLRKSAKYAASRCESSWGWCVSILRGHEKVREVLSGAAKKGNESIVATDLSRDPSFDSKRIKTDKQGSPSKLDELLNSDSNADFQRNLIGKVENKKAELTLFYNHVSGILEHALTVDSTTVGCIKNTVDAILSFDGQRNSDNAKAQNIDAPYGRPPFEGMETQADQPILHAITLGILRILDPTLAVSTERVMPNPQPLEVSKGRRVDFLVHQIAEYLTSLFPAMLEGPIEVKVVGENESRFEKYQNAGTYQDLCHQARRLQYSLDFGGVGEDRKSIGVVLTMASVQVFELELEGVGTDKVQPKLCKTDRLPLMKLDIYNFLSMNDSDGVATEEGATEEGATDGFLVFAGALHACTTVGESFCRNLFDSPEAQKNQEENQNYTYLGSGTFCHAVCSRRGKDDGRFVKIPKAVAMEESLQTELNILSRLNEGTTEDEEGRGIPRLAITGVNVLSKIRVVDKLESSSLHCLELKGIVGQACNSPDFNKGFIPTIITSVFDALEFSHSRGVGHYDLRPGNIIWVWKDEKPHVMLTDWGCAILFSIGRQTKFRGSLPYAHDELYGLSWNPNGMHDFASLVYTAVHLLEDSLPWDFFSRPTTVNNTMLDKRRNHVISKKKELFFGIKEEKVQVLEKATRLDSSKFNALAPATTSAIT